MNEIVKIETKNGLNVVSSRTIAEQLGKRHDGVLRDIDNIIEKSTPQICGELIKSEYIASNGKRNREYLLTKDGFTLYMFNIQGFNDFKMAYINQFNKMEQALIQKQRVLPSNYVEALEELLKKEKENQLLVAELKENEPKLDYFETVLGSESFINAEKIAKSLGIKSANALNKMLVELGVIYSRRAMNSKGQITNTWLLKADYVEKGYAYNKPYPYFDSKGNKHTRDCLKWTEKGRNFIYELLKKKKGIEVVKE